MPKKQRTGASPSRSRRPAEAFGPRAKRAETSLAWVFEPLEADGTYHRRRMFGCDAAYLDEILYLVVADKSEPWNGLLVCTSHNHHAALTAELPALQTHTVLGKWLYVSQRHPQFEDTAHTLTALALKRDQRFGVRPKPRGRKAKLPKK